MAYREPTVDAGAFVASASGDDALAYARTLGLVPVSRDDLTVERRGDANRGFSYFCRRTGRAPAARRIGEIEAMALPPAWAQVTIARDPAAHIQAIGRDERGREQYRYHEGWTQVREEMKVRRLARFAAALPRIRERVARDLDGPLTARDTVVALVVRLIDLGHLRVGGERYAAAGTRGATTLRTGNVAVDGDKVRLSFRAKAGKAARLAIEDRRLANRLRKLKHQRRGRLFAWHDGEAWRRVSAAQVNDYLTRAAGEPLSAKDFRTFAGSALAIREMAELTDEPARRRLPEVVRRVAKRLRNTPAVARSSYVHGIVQRLAQAPEEAGRLLKGPTRKGMTRHETALARLLQRVQPSR